MHVGGCNCAYRGKVGEISLSVIACRFACIFTHSYSCIIKCAPLVFRVFVRIVGWVVNFCYSFGASLHFRWLEGIAFMYQIIGYEKIMNTCLMWKNLVRSDVSWNESTHNGKQIYLYECRDMSLLEGLSILLVGPRPALLLSGHRLIWWTHPSPNDALRPQWKMAHTDFDRPSLAIFVQCDRKESTIYEHGKK